MLILLPFIDALQPKVVMNQTTQNNTIKKAYAKYKRGGQLPSTIIIIKYTTNPNK